ncbi:MAG: hypothetical protein P1U87_08905 [Verrucomicrobiales bacterium]|nr:hypothetical protein [Verrucomicrobiales bacterium]
MKADSNGKEKTNLLRDTARNLDDPPNTRAERPDHVHSGRLQVREIGQASEC